MLRLQHELCKAKDNPMRYLIEKQDIQVVTFGSLSALFEGDRYHDLGI